MALGDAQRSQFGVEKRGVRVGGPAVDFEGLVMKSCVVGWGGKSDEWGCSLCEAVWLSGGGGWVGRFARSVAEGKAGLVTNDAAT